MRPGSPAAFLTLAAAFFLSTVLFGVAAHKPLHLDNMDFPAAAEATSHSGLPVYYRGEQLSRYEALYHPPLYIYCLATWMKIFGATPASVRFFGYGCLLLHGVIVLLLFKTILGDSMPPAAAVFFWLLLLLNPYSLQTASIADIDSTIYGPALCLAVLLALRLAGGPHGACGAGPGRNSWLLLVCALSAAFWMKLTTIWILLPAVWLIFRPRWGWWGALARASACFVAGFALFAGTYQAYGWCTGLKTAFSYSFLWESLAVRGSHGARTAGAWIGVHLGNIRIMAEQLVAWGGPFVWVLLGASVLLSWRRYHQTADRRAWNVLVLNLLCVATAGFYCFLTLSFGGAPFKYAFVVWPMSVMSAALLVSGFRWEADPAASPAGAWGRRRVGLLAAAFLAGALLAVSYWKDGLLSRGIVSWAGAWTVALPGVVAFCAALAAGAGRRRRRWARLALVAAVVAPAGVWSGVALYQARADFSTTYDYGQRGFEDTVAFIRLTTSQDQTIASMKDIGYAAKRRFWENYAAIYGGEAGARQLIDYIRSGKCRYAVFTENHGQDQLIMNPVLQRWIGGNCRIVRSFGDYRVYDCGTAGPAGR